jgi:nitrogen regulatory protein PII
MNADTRFPRTSSVQITCIVPRDSSAALSSAFDSLKITEYLLQPARRTMLGERKNSRGSIPISHELVDIVRFCVPEASADSVVDAMAEILRFGEPGRGSIVQRRVNLEGQAVQVFEDIKTSRVAQKAQGLAGLCCVVARGDGTDIARVLLEAGLGAPTVTYGRGVGSREKLGLIRVTIPAEKELVNLLLSRRDVEEAFNIVSEVMKLGHRPGAGFCYWYPLESGILDTRIWIGRQLHVASMEQVISALDIITGDTAWRRKSGGLNVSAGRPMKMVVCSIHGPERETETAVRAALAAGAGGATRSLTKRELIDASGRSGSAREVTDIVMVKSVLPQVLQAITESGLYGQDGFVEVSDVGASSGYNAARE